MTWKINEALENIEEQELYRLQDDLASGAELLKRIVSDRIKRIEKAKSGICVTCGNNLEEHPRSYTLVFGPDGFRKKAGFCELDCLEYFLANLKKLKGDKNELQACNKDV
jgi:hypothetical protein